MREFKKRRSRRAELLNFSIRLLGALALLGITAIAVRGAWDMYGRLKVASAGQEDAQGQLQVLQAQQAEVTASVGELSSSRGVEALMRERFGVVRPGEGVIQIVHTAPTSTPTDNNSRGFFGQLFHLLFSW